MKVKLFNVARERWLFRHGRHAFAPANLARVLRLR